MKNLVNGECFGMESCNSPQGKVPVIPGTTTFQYFGPDYIGAVVSSTSMCCFRLRFMDSQMYSK